MPAPRRTGKPLVPGPVRLARRGAAYCAHGGSCGGPKHLNRCDRQDVGHFVGPGSSGNTGTQHRGEQRDGIQATHQLAAADEIRAGRQEQAELLANRLVDRVPLVVRAGPGRCRLAHRVPRPLRRLTVTWRSASYASISERRCEAVKSGSDWMASMTSTDPFDGSSPRSTSAETLRDSAIARSTSSEGARSPRSIWER